jgi:ADP-heptose:LPS heptosyltransferase
MAAMRMADYFIGIDSGPRNMAHLADLRSISLFGPGIRDFMPLSRKDIVIDKSNPMATSLFHYSRESSMKKISAEEVFEAFRKISHE